jgi:RNA polymerase sigma-70 factor (ECF subfamily)
MYTTSVSLLDRLRQPNESDAWTRFVRLYTPLLYSWATRVGLQPQDASDLVQDILIILIEKLPEFRYDPRQSFRGWLRTITRNKCLERLRQRGRSIASISESRLADLEQPDVADAFEEKDYQQYLVGRALELMRTDFEPTTWRACWEYVVSGRSAADVAKELGVTVDVVYSAKSRVLRRLRQELQGLIE